MALDEAVAQCFEVEDREEDQDSEVLEEHSSEWAKVEHHNSRTISTMTIGVVEVAEVEDLDGETMISHNAIVMPRSISEQIGP